MIRGKFNRGNIFLGKILLPILILCIQELLKVACIFLLLGSGVIILHLHYKFAG